MDGSSPSLSLAGNKSVAFDGNLRLSVYLFHMQSTRDPLQPSRTRLPMTMRTHAHHGTPPPSVVVAVVVVVKVVADVLVDVTVEDVDVLVDVDVVVVVVVVVIVVVVVVVVDMISSRSP